MRTTVPITSSNLILEVFQGVNENFVNETLGGALLSTLQLRLQFRLICTPGSCGTDCSQTTNCSPYPPACRPDCDNSMPCMNGGTCMVRILNY